MPSTQKVLGSCKLILLLIEIKYTFRMEISVVWVLGWDGWISQKMLVKWRVIFLTLGIFSLSKQLSQEPMGTGQRCKKVTGEHTVFLKILL